jgi:uncharacterized protein
MMPFHFGPEDAPLFGVYTPPRASVVQQAAVLLCAPIGMEYMRTQYTFRLLASQLAAAGIHVLRFDYRGMGDSSGSVGKGQLDCWLDDIVFAARELYELSGVESPIVIGLRMGAALGILALASRKIKAKALVLWDPVVHGHDYLATLKRMHAELISERREPPMPSEELLGSPFPADLISAIENLNIEQHVHQISAGNGALVVSEDLPSYLPLLSAMRSQWPEMLYQQMTEPIDWDTLKSAYESRMTGPIVRAVAEVAESLA